MDQLESLKRLAETVSLDDYFNDAAADLLNESWSGACLTDHISNAFKQFRRNLGPLQKRILEVKNALEEEKGIDLPLDMIEVHLREKLDPQHHSLIPVLLDFEQ